MKTVKYLIISLAGVAVAAAQPYAYISNQQGNTVIVVNRATYTVNATIPISGGGLSGLAIMPGGAYVYVTEQSKGSVAIISTVSNTVVGTVKVGSSPVQVAFTPSGLWAYVTNAQSNNVSVINTATETVVATIPVGSKPSGIAITSDGAEVLVTNLLSANISVISTASNSVTATWTALSGPIGIAISGIKVFVADQYANSLTVHNLITGAIEATLAGLSAPNAVAVTPDGTQIYVSNGNTSAVWAIAASTLTVEAKIAADLLPTAVVVSADGSTAYAISGFGYSLTAINTATNTIVHTMLKIGIYPFSIAAMTAAMPATPTSVVGTANASTNVTVTWTENVTAGGLPIASYQIYRGSSASTLSQIASTPATSYTDKSVSASTNYYYAVQATDSGGNTSPMSVQVSITTLPLPNTPTGLVATATAATKIVLTWTDTVPPKGLPILNYQVYCGLAPSSLTNIAMASGGSYTYTGLTPGTMYYCAVLASDTAGDLSPTSALASAMTAAMPAIPTSVVGTANASTNVTVTWTENVAAGGLPIASYQIYRGSSASNLVKLASRTTTSYVDTAVSAQTTYFYAVQATDTAGDISLMSTTSQVVVPLAEKLLNGRLPWVLAPSKPGAP